jgi:hypothetical protein
MPSRARRPASRRPAPEQTLDALTAVKERRKDRPLAPEVARAREAKGEPARAGKPAAKPKEAEAEIETSNDAPPPDQPPATLAEQLLATKKKKR